MLFFVVVGAALRMCTFLQVYSCSPFWSVYWILLGGGGGCNIYFLTILLHLFFPPQYYYATLVFACETTNSKVFVFLFSFLFVNDSSCKKTKFVIQFYLSKFEPLKPSRSGDITLLIFKISKEAVKKPCLDQKIQCLFSKYSYTSCVYFDIKISGLSPIYPNVYFKTIRSGTYKIGQKRWLCAFNVL